MTRQKGKHPHGNKRKLGLTRLLLTVAVVPSLFVLAGCGTKAGPQNAEGNRAPGTVIHNGSSSVAPSNGTAVNSTTSTTPSTTAIGQNSTNQSSDTTPQSAFVPHFSSVDMVTPTAGWASGQIAGDVALWRSRYGGVVWARVPLPFVKSVNNGTGFAMSVYGTHQLLVANVTATGVQTYETTDGGKSWLKLGQVNTSDTMISYFHFINRTDGWMVTDNGVAAHESIYHLFQTTDGGKTWHMIAKTNNQNPFASGSIPGYGEAVFSFEADGTGWMTGQGFLSGKGFLMRSSDGGKSWTTIRVPVPSADVSTLVTTSKPIYSNGMTAIVVQYQGQNRNTTVILRINGQGQVVSTSSPLITNTPVMTNFASPLDGWATTAPWQPNHPQLYRTTNGGQTWEAMPVNDQMLMTNPRMHFITPTVGFAFAANQDTGSPVIWRTRDGGQTWQRLMMKIYATGGPASPNQNSSPPPPQFTPGSIDFVSGSVGYLIGNYGNGQTEEGRVYKTTDAGKHWTEIYHTGVGIAAIDALGNDVWISVGAQAGSTQGTLMFSRDGGKSFTRLASRGLTSIDFVSPNDGYAVQAGDMFNNKLLSTRDGGQIWKVQSLPIAKSTNGNVQAFAALGSPTSVSFADKLHGILLQTGEPGAGQQPKSVLDTEDGGTSWAVVSSAGMGGNSARGQFQLGSGGYANGIDMVSGNPSTAYIWESRGPLIYTSNGGKSWEASSLTKPGELEATSVSMLNTKDGFVLIHDMGPSGSSFILEKTTDGLQSWQPVYQWQ